MTRVAGFRQVRAPCCGKVYVRPHYHSMNFMAAEHWSDGWREASLIASAGQLEQGQPPRTAAPAFWSYPTNAA